MGGGEGRGSCNRRVSAFVFHIADTSRVSFDSMLWTSLVIISLAVILLSVNYFVQISLLVMRLDVTLFPVITQVLV